MCACVWRERERENTTKETSSADKSPGTPFQIAYLHPMLENSQLLTSNTMHGKRYNSKEKLMATCKMQTTPV